MPFVRTAVPKGTGASRKQEIVQGIHEALVEGIRAGRTLAGQGIAGIRVATLLDGPLPAEFATSRKEGVTQGYLDRTSGSGYAFNKNSDEAGVLSPAELKSRSELLQARLKERNQGSPTQRRYLSEPPLTYREPAASAPVGDPGEDEETKARRLRGNGPGVLDKIGELLPF